MRKPPSQAMGSVLIVDDRPEDRQLLGDVLQAQGYEIVLATNAHDALERTRKAVPDLILLDIRGN